MPTVERLRWSNALSHSTVVGLVGYVVPVKNDAASADGLGPRKHVKQSGLTRSVRTYHRMHSVGAHLEIDATDRDKLIVVFFNTNGFKQNGCAHVCSRLPRT